jgi:hypothetical protein
MDTETAVQLIMDTKRTGGPAFPDTGWDDITFQYVPRSGMTLLDYFAARYIASGRFDFMEDSDEKIAAWAYDLAEAMLAERTKRMGRS